MDEGIEVQVKREKEAIEQQSQGVNLCDVGVLVQANFLSCKVMHILNLNYESNSTDQNVFQFSDIRYPLGVIK